MTIMSNTLDNAGIRPGSARLRNVALSTGSVLLLAVLLLGLFGRLMSYGLRRDEMLFAPPASYLPEWKLYADVFYNHVPYSAWVFHGIHALVPEIGVIGAGRIGVFLAWTILIATVGWLCQRISGCRLLSAFWIVAFLACDPLLQQTGMAATNNFLPLPFAMLGLGLFVSEILDGRPRVLALLVSGICLSVAAGLKANAVAFIPPVAIATFLLPRSMTLSTRLLRVVGPVALGGIVGAIPLFWYLLSDPALFLAHVLEFHTGPHVAYWEANAGTEPGLALGLGAKVRLAYETWLNGVPLIMTLVVLSGLLVGMRRADGAGARPGAVRPAMAVVLAALMLSGALSFIPTPGFPQYYVQPFVCLPLLSALAVRQSSPARLGGVLSIFVAGLLVALIISLPRLGAGLVEVQRPDRFASARVDQGGMALARAIADQGSPAGPVATFMPVYPLAAGLDVYPEFATGPFAYRVAPFTDPELAARYRIAGPDDLPVLFDDNPPAAFLIGYDPEAEGPMRDWAISAGYTEVPVSGLDNRYGRGVVLVRPGGEAP